jgi:lysozyme family protein
MARCRQIIFDWCVNSGHWGSRGVQRTLNQFFNANLKMDGLIGNQTLSEINQCNPRELFNAIKAARIRYYYTIAKRGLNFKFLKGWLKRIESFEFDWK